MISMSAGTRGGSVYGCDAPCEAVHPSESEANHRTEELKSALLSSVSHDLRTPLTTISASASSLIEYGHRFDDTTAHNLLQGIVDECNRLNRFTANLLELSRLQSGGASLSGQILSVQDVARAAVQRLRTAVGDRELTLAAPPEDILVKAEYSPKEAT